MRFDRKSEHNHQPHSFSASPRTSSYYTSSSEPLASGLFPDQWSSLRSSSRKLSIDERENGSRPMDGIESTSQSSQRDYARRISERWRYDAETGAVGVGMGIRGLEDEERLIVDEYEDRLVFIWVFSPLQALSSHDAFFSSRHLRVRLGLFEDSDISLLSTDGSHLVAAQRAAEESPERPPPVILVRPPAPPPPQPPQLRRVASSNGAIPRPPSAMNGMSSPALGIPQPMNGVVHSSPLVDSNQLPNASMEGSPKFHKDMIPAFPNGQKPRMPVHPSPYPSLPHHPHHIPNMPPARFPPSQLSSF